MSAAKKITTITANPIPTTDFIFVDTPKKEHKPKNCISTMLLINIDEIKIANNSIIS
jgi:hypothetical protein